MLTPAFQHEATIRQHKQQQMQVPRQYMSVPRIGDDYHTRKQKDIASSLFSPRAIGVYMKAFSDVIR
jgi:hypothetical protein